MNNNNIFIFLFLFLLVPTLAFADDYTSIGSNDNFYQGSSFFNSELDDLDIVTSARPLTDGNFVPLVYDFDNDEIKEYLVMDDINMVIYSGTELSVKDTILVGSRYSQPIIMDIDGDGDAEIILTRSFNESVQYMNITIYNFSNNVFGKEKDFEISIWNHMDSVVQCDSTSNYCLAQIEHIDEDIEIITNNTIFAFSYNGTYNKNVLPAKNDDSDIVNHYCIPTIAHITNIDYDLDGTNEMILSALEGVSNIWSGNIYAFYLDSSKTWQIEKSYSLTDNDVGGFQTAPTNRNICDFYVKTNFDNSKRVTSIMSSPSVYDYDQSPSNGKEIVFAMLTDVNPFEFRLFKIDSSFTSIEQYPKLLSADGALVSNIVRMNAFPNSGRVDFCALGLEDANILGGIDNRSIDLLCASDIGSGTLGVDSEEFPAVMNFKIDYGNDDDTPEGGIEGDYHRNYFHMIHAIQSDGTLTQDENLDEIIGTFGVARLVWGEPLNELVSEWVLPQSSSSVVPIDNFEINRANLLVLKDSNVFLYTDGFVNLGCGDFSNICIREVRVNPSNEQTWKQDTSTEIRVRINDIDGDLITARVYMYYGETQEELINWTNSYASGTFIPFSNFNTSTLTPNSIIRIEARDVKNNDSIDILEIPFSVAESGIEFGDAINIIDFEGVAIAIKENNTVVDSDDIVTKASKQLANTTGLTRSLSFLIMVLAFSIIISFFILDQLKNHTAKDLMLLSGFISMIGMYIGTKIQIVSTGLFITIIILLIGFMALSFTKFFSSDNGV